MNNFKKFEGLTAILNNNKKWAEEMVKKDENYFQSLVQVQRPQYLWIGCADSRVPANEIMSLKPGEVFVHRNVANVVSPSDINVLAVIQYAVQVLKVKDIMVTGHYGCGGIKAAFKKHDFGALEAWLSNIRQLRARYRDILINHQTEETENLLTEMNVRQQVINVARIPIVQQAWKEGQKLVIHGLVYDLRNGLLKDLGLSISDLKDLPEEYRIVE